MSWIRAGCSRGCESSSQALARNAQQSAHEPAAYTGATERHGQLAGLACGGALILLGDPALLAAMRAEDAVESGTAEEQRAHSDRCGHLTELEIEGLVAAEGI